MIIHCNWNQRCR